MSCYDSCVKRNQVWPNRNPYFPYKLVENRHDIGMTSAIPH
jgi:hypothetical protein